MSSRFDWEPRRQYRPTVAIHISCENYINKAVSCRTNGLQDHSMLVATVRFQCKLRWHQNCRFPHTDMSNRTFEMLDYIQKFNRWCFSVREYLLNRKHLVGPSGVRSPCKVNNLKSCELRMRFWSRRTRKCLNWHAVDYFKWIFSIFHVCSDRRTTRRDFWQRVTLFWYVRLPWRTFIYNYVKVIIIIHTLTQVFLHICTRFETDFGKIVKTENVQKYLYVWAVLLICDRDSKNIIATNLWVCFYNFKTFCLQNLNLKRKMKCF